MIGLKGEFHSLLSLMQTKLQIETREGMYTMRRCLDARVLNEGKIGKGTLT